MSSQIKSPGAELNRLLGAMGFSAQAGELSGAALDRAIQNDRGIASNLLDAFSQLQDNEQVALKKLKQEINNFLKSMNNVVKQGPLAAIRG